MAEIKSKLSSSSYSCVYGYLMSGLHRKDRIEILAEQNHLKLIADSSFSQSLLKAAVLFKIQQVKDRIIYQAVLKIAAVQHFLHDLRNDLRVARSRSFRQYNQRQAGFLRGSDDLLVIVMIGRILALKDHHARHPCLRQFAYSIYLGGGVVSHS